MKEQMKRVITLSEMVTEYIDLSLNYSEYRKECIKLNQEKFFKLEIPEEPTNSEIKRLMLVLRKETIKLDKMMSNKYF